MLDEVSIFWEYHDISLNNRSYRGYSFISKYHIPIVFNLRMLKSECNSSLQPGCNTSVILAVRVNISQSPLANRIVRYSRVKHYLYHVM